MAWGKPGGVHADDIVVFLAWALAIGAVGAAAFGASLLVGPAGDSFRAWKAASSVDAGGPETPVEIGVLYPVHGPIPNETEINAANATEVEAESRPSEALPSVVIVNPSWREQPRPQFPQAAAFHGIEEGRVQLECFVRADGLIVACSVQQETPSGYGFGRAAIAATHDARLQPRSVNGVTTPGKVRFSTHFILR